MRLHVCLHEDNGRVYFDLADVIGFLGTNPKIVTKHDVMEFLKETLNDAEEKWLD